MYGYAWREEVVAVAICLADGGREAMQGSRRVFADVSSKGAVTVCLEQCDSGSG
jgi:hypothetical protein